MTPTDWLAKFRKEADILRMLVAHYHPARPNPRKSPLPITAPNAEAACEVIRKEIAQEHRAPVKDRFEVALATGNTSELMSILSQTWFGVPESADCWSIPGFHLLVDLLDDPPEEEGPSDADVPTEVIT